MAVLPLVQQYLYCWHSTTREHSTKDPVPDLNYRSVVGAASWRTSLIVNRRIGIAWLLAIQVRYVRHFAEFCL